MQAGHGGGGSREGHSVAPHMRRAHWHTYVTGEGSRKDASKRIYQLRWLRPVPVNIESVDDVAPVASTCGYCGPYMPLHSRCRCYKLPRS